MAIAESSLCFQDMRLDSGTRSPKRASCSDEETNKDGASAADQYGYFKYDSPLAEHARRAENVNEHISTPPIPIGIAIPSAHNTHNGSSMETVSLSSRPLHSDHSSMDEFLHNRRTSITFDPTIRLESGERQDMEQPLQKPAKPRTRGRSLLQAMADDMDYRQRAHSESGQKLYDSITGESISQHKRKERDAPHVGQLRHPILPATVDELALESQTDSPGTMTSDATVSPTVEELRTPLDNHNDFLLSPVTTSPFTQAHSFDEKANSRRSIDRTQTAAADFFARGGSYRRGPYMTSNRQNRRSTSSSTKSPKSAASSFLASFSSSRRSRNGNNDCFDNVPTSPDAEGQTVGDDYVLGKQIGFGGFSVIKEAFHMNADGSQRKIAVKIVRRNIQGKNEYENEQAQAEFDHEIELWRFLKHPRILPLEAVYKTEDATFCFIPLNTGGTLFDLVRANRSGVPSKLARRYAYQLATAIRYLHEDARVAHRDIKLENCLLDTSVDPHNVRLCDFGMAEWITNDGVSSYDCPPSPSINSVDRPPQRNIGPSETSTSAFAGGSLEYAAPEIVRIATESTLGNRGREVERGLVSPTSDIWALGVCFYTLIVGSRPFQDSFQPRVVMAILAGDWDQNRLREKGGEDALELIQGCLEMDVRDRWDIEEVLACDWSREEADKGEDEEGESGLGSHGAFGGNVWGLGPR